MISCLSSIAELDCSLYLGEFPLHKKGPQRWERSVKSNSTFVEMTKADQRKNAVITGSAKHH
jgi:hypothetical protein